MVLRASRRNRFRGALGGGLVGSGFAALVVSGLNLWLGKPAPLVWAGLLLGLPAFGAHEAVGEGHAAFAEAQGGDHAVAIEGMVHPGATALQSPRPIAIEGAAQLGGNGPAHGSHRHLGELLAHVAEGTGPVVAVEGGTGGSRLALTTGGNGHGRGKALMPPSSRKGV